MFLRSLAILLLVGIPLRAQTPGDAMIEKYLAAEADKLSQKFLDGAQTLAEWQQKRPRLQREYLDMLSLWPLPAKTPLHAMVTGTFEAHGVVVEKLHYQSKPGLYVTGSLFRPKQVAKKLPAILYVCGHSSRGRDGGRNAFQDHGFWFANNGYVCLTVDTLQLGEIAGIHHGTYNKGRWWWHSAGYTPAGVECWNGVRGIDYLLTRPEVDPEHIGVTGISGGGASTFWIAAADERVKVAVPVSGMSDLESYVTNKVINGHCDCMFLYNTYRWDWTTIAALVAPRPLLFANSDNDPIFPMDGNRRIIAKLRKLYEMYGRPDLVDEYVSVGGHAYRPDLRVAIFKFLNKHLKGDTTSPVEDSAQYTEIKGPQVRVFPEDSDIPKDQLNTRIDEFFVPRAQVELPEPGKFKEWKAGLLQALCEKCFHAFPDRIPVGKGFDLHETMLVNTGARAAGVIALDTGGSAPLFVLNTASAASHFEKRLKAIGQAEKRSLYAIWTMGGEVMPWTKKSPPNYVERAHALLGRTVDQGIVWDFIATARLMQKKDLRVGGAGRDGILAAYAALLEPSIKEVVVIEPPTSHKEGPHFLGVQRVLDIPEALGLLAPTPLTIIGGNDPAFDRTAEIYRRAGAADKLRRQ